MAIEQQEKLTPTLNEKILAIQNEVGCIDKNGENTFYNYSFPTWEDINKNIRKLLIKHRVHCWTTTLEEKTQPLPEGNLLTIVKLKLLFTDLDSGEQIDCIFYGAGRDSTDKGIPKAYTGGLKSAFLKIFLISTGDDPENEDLNHRQSKQVSSVVYLNLRKAALEGEVALRQAWRELSTTEKREIYPCRETLKQIARDTHAKQKQTKPNSNYKNSLD